MLQGGEGEGTKSPFTIQTSIPFSQFSFTYNLWYKHFSNTARHKKINTFIRSYILIADVHSLNDKYTQQIFKSISDQNNHKVYSKENLDSLVLSVLLWYKQAFVQVLFSTAAFSQRFKFFTVCLIQWLSGVAPWKTLTGTFLKFRSVDHWEMYFWGFFFLEF